MVQCSAGSGPATVTPSLSGVRVVCVGVECENGVLVCVTGVGIGEVLLLAWD